MSREHVFFGKLLIKKKDGTDEYEVSIAPMADWERDALAGIVRCRNCKHFATNIHGSYCKKSISTTSDPNGFCAWASRKESE